MNSNWKDKWNERYRLEGFAYGEQPNDYLKQQLKTLKPGTALFPAEGEGRNAIYAAALGWESYAFDISEEGKKKALKLAESRGLEINYLIGNIETIDYSFEQFDMIALIYAHFPADIKSAYHQKLKQYLKKGGIVIFEAFSKNHLAFIAKNEKVGGPKDIDMLFSIEEIKSDFSDFDIIELAEHKIDLKEGRFHDGRASVLRFVGRKK